MIEIQANIRLGTNHVFRKIIKLPKFPNIQEGKNFLFSRKKVTDNPVYISIEFEEGKNIPVAFICIKEILVEGRERPTYTFVPGDKEFTVMNLFLAFRNDHTWERVDEKKKGVIEESLEKAFVENQ